MKGQEILFSRKSDEWATPQNLYEQLDKEFKFTLDPCATEGNAKCEKFYTREIDGLAQSWENEVVFINPPYSQIKQWVEKAYVESIVNGAICVLLLPARTDTKWFHNFIYQVDNVEYRFLKGRLKFTVDGQPLLNKQGQPQAAPFPSMVVIFNGQAHETKD
jgi:phage N-6-adenine-methyltransferase